MKFDREALSDCFQSLSLAKEIRRQFNLEPDESAPLREIADSIGIWRVTEKKLNSIEGALIVPDGKLEGEILLNSNQHPSRKRFTFAHELGHFVHPFHHPANQGKFECTNRDVFQNHNREKVPQIENEANEFASEILLPVNSLKSLTNTGSDLTFEKVIQLCDKMEVSKAFAIRKLQSLCKAKTAFIFSHKGKIKYLQCDDFPFLKVWSKEHLPARSYANEVASDNTVLEKREISPDVWLKKQINTNLYEQTFIQENGYRITMLILG